MGDREQEPSSRQTPADIEELLQWLDVSGATLVDASWTEGLRDFELAFEDGGVVLFADCVQVSFHRPPSWTAPLRIGGWWTDEPSPLLQSLSPELRFRYHHVVFEVGEGLLRIACRRVEAARA